MTWRSLFYCMLCLVAALVVASAACTSPEESQAKTGVAPGVVAMQILPVPVPEPARAVALIFGMAAIVLTYQQAWRNFRRQ